MRIESTLNLAWGSRCKYDSMVSPTDVDQVISVSIGSDGGLLFDVVHGENARVRVPFSVYCSIHSSQSKRGAIIQFIDQSTLNIEKVPLV